MDYYGMGDFGGFDVFDAIEEAGKSLIPVFAGGGVAFGTAEAINFLVKNEDVRKWKWAIGAGASTLVGLALYKLRSDTEGVVTIATGALMAGAGFAHEKLTEYKASQVTTEGLRAYQLRPSRTLYAGEFGAYEMEKAQPLLAGLGAQPEIVDFRQGTMQGMDSSLLV